MATYNFLVISNYMSVIVKGVLSIPEFRKITDEMLALSREKDIHKVIIDVTDTAGTFSDVDKIEFARYATDVLKDDIYKYAYVYPHEFLNYSSQHVSQGRGFNARAYYSVEHALEWIEED